MSAVTYDNLFRRVGIVKIRGRVYQLLLQITHGFPVPHLFGFRNISSPLLCLWGVNFILCYSIASSIPEAFANLGTVA